MTLFRSICTRLSARFAGMLLLGLAVSAHAQFRVEVSGVGLTQVPIAFAPFRGEDSSPQQYLLLVGALRSLANADHDASLILDSYLLRALSIAGWAPNFVDCAHCGEPGPHQAFVMQLGGVVCRECRPAGAAVIDERTGELLGALLSGDWQVADASPESIRAAASGIVSAYSQWHIERGLKSLQHVERK